jgi:hypothetical protein
MKKFEGLIYSNDRVGPWRLYVYELHSEYHSGGQWFARQVVYPDEEISVVEARARCMGAMAYGREVRVTDAGDNLVFHSKGSDVFYGSGFWDEVFP